MGPERFCRPCIDLVSHFTRCVSEKRKRRTCSSWAEMYIMKPECRKRPLRFSYLWHRIYGDGQGVKRLFSPTFSSTKRERKTLTFLLSVVMNGESAPNNKRRKQGWYEGGVHVSLVLTTSERTLSTLPARLEKWGPEKLADWILLLPTMNCFIL